MDWRSKSGGGVMVVAPGGAIDHENADAFDTRLMGALADAAHAGQRLIIDFSGVDYMSSVGLRVLARVAKAARDQSADIAVACLGETMAEIFQISRFDKIFSVFDTVDAARAG